MEDDRKVCGGWRWLDDWMEEVATSGNERIVEIDSVCSSFTVEQKNNTSPTPVTMNGQVLGGRTRAKETNTTPTKSEGYWNESVYHPNYMSSTESFKAKKKMIRSHSEPRQRPAEIPVKRYSSIYSNHRRHHQTGGTLLYSSPSQKSSSSSLHFKAYPVSGQFLS